MKYLTFGSQESASYRICILVNDIRRDEIKRTYIDPYGLDPEEIIVISLHQAPGKKKTPAAEMKAYIAEELSSVLTELKVEFLLVADGDYFKTFTGASKVDAMLGYMLPSKLTDHHVAYVPNFRTVFYDPIKVVEKVALGINALKSWIAGTYQDPGADIIEFAEYPARVEDVESWLIALHKCPALSCDIEGFGLKHYDAGIGTITFCWNKTSGIAFPIDIHGDHVYAMRVRKLLKQFFEAYQGTLIWHSISYDVYVLVYQLFMDHLLDNEGMLQGLEILLPKGRWHCTKLISYLATNSCAGNRLSLKIQAQEYAGDYAQEEIKDIRKIPLPALLQYNLVDGLSTWFVFEKHWGTLVADQQLEIYETIFQPATVDIVQMQLTGMPVDMAQVLEVEQILTVILDDAVKQMQGNPKLGAYVHHLKEEHVRKRNEKLKTKQISLADDEVAKVAFNPRSPDQLQELLFEHLALPILGYTDSKQPSTKGEFLKSLQKHTQDPDVIALLEALVGFKAVDKILGTFIEALKNSQLGNDGWYYLFGNFNLGGTVSGRLSSSGPNLQNLPANVAMLISAAIAALLGERIAKFVSKGKLHLGKLIKSCFKAPPGWFFCGIDFASLEDRISALTTKDPNKLKVYTDGYDGHSLRAHSYFGDQMTGIDPNQVDSINSIADLYPVFRQESKVPTFLLTYGGTHIGIMAQMAWPKAKAQDVEARYHELYKVSDEWVASKVNQACRDGYVTAAFGLRVRTPLLSQVVRGTTKTPFEAEAEGRTAGNALGQSWCLLNSRAGSETMGKVRSSQFRHDIKPCAQIHDAQYFLVRDNIEAVRFANENVVAACQWQDHPDIWHEEVKLGGEFSIFYPTWADEVGIPNNATAAETYAAFEKHILKLETKKAA
jgi:DNA polymerase-1